jgi:hypothetical protein
MFMLKREAEKLTPAAWALGVVVALAGVILLASIAMAYLGALNLIGELVKLLGR